MLVGMVDMGDNMDIVDSMTKVDSIDMGNMQKLSFLKVASRPFMAIVDSGQQRYIYYARKIDQDGTEFIPIASNLRLLPLDLIGPNCPE